MNVRWKGLVAPPLVREMGSDCCRKTFQQRGGYTNQCSVHAGGPRIRQQRAGYKNQRLVNAGRARGAKSAVGAQKGRQMKQENANGEADKRKHARWESRG